jgi:hypothetical protein
VLAALRGLVVLDDIGGGARLDGLADLNVLVTAHQPGPAARADGPPPPDATFDLVVRASEIGDVDGA